MKKVLISAPVNFLPSLKALMSKTFNCTFAYHFSKKDTIALLNENEYEGWLVSPCPTYYIDEDLLSHCPALKIIATPSTGTNHLDIDNILKRGIEFFSLRGFQLFQ